AAGFGNIEVVAPLLARAKAVEPPRAILPPPVKPAPEFTVTEEFCSAVFGMLLTLAPLMFVSADPLPLKLEAVSVPFTSNVVLGFDLPMPTFPFGSMKKRVTGLEPFKSRT